ncbi:hemagglutinin repeat-containing protein [Burkholderia vietnamiensis]|uniref:hemagglutinin repeat-containing protein n=1 Tax=Burkholderia vietnamiensis TaxID=60552 RepID=UPI0009BEE2DA|nr:hemagglutinin repeat-containing protein [Burkholderia vietnamiensis]HDV8353798.1 hemagglutinin repeat-containing protein [Burkholderia vietnamiensis]
MNKNNYRLIFSRVRGMLIAVEETASASGNAGQGEAVSVTPILHVLARFALRHSAFAVLVLTGATPMWANAQIVGGGAHAPSVIQTQNGLPQVNINKPGGAGVSLNTYNQFDVQKNGAILNNSPGAVNTQQAGMINGNPNFGPNDAARIIVNQVNSNNPSSIRGFVEIAGQKAELIISNPAGLQIDGGGFINTSRAVLTTGVPYYGADGSVAGFNVNRGLVTVSGSGLNAANTDQVDIIARAVQANAAIYAKNLNVIAGSNQVNHDTLAAMPIQGDGAAPAVAIDVGQLGGMYANRIFLVSSGSAVGVQNAGTLSADAAGMTLTTDGRLVQSGKISSLGNVTVSADGGIDNNGTTYSQQSVSMSTGADMTNSGTLAAQHNVGVNAGSLNSTGAIGAGVDSNGTVTQAGDLQIMTTGQLNATGQNIAGGNATLRGYSVNLAGSKTAANGSVTLNADTGDINLSNATTSAQGALSATAAGAIVNDHGSLSSQSGATLTAGSASNQGGTVSSQGSLTVHTSGAISNQAGTLVSQNTVDLEGGTIANQQGIIQSAGQMKVVGASLQNTAGRVTSLNSDGLSITTSGQLTNAAGTTANGAQGGVIGGDGNVSVQAGSIANQGSISAATDLTVGAQSVDNGSGTLTAGQNAFIDAGAHLANASGSISAGALASVRATNLDNSSGSLLGSQLSLTATDLKNQSGTITQTGTNPTTIAVSGTLDNSLGTVQTNSADLSLTPATLINDHGKIAHAGSGTLTIGTGTLSNQGGSIATNGAMNVQAAAVSNQAGTIAAQRQASLTVQSLDNRSGGTVNAATVDLHAQGTVENSGGAIEADQLAVSAADFVNHGGTVLQTGTGATTIAVTNALDNTSGKLQSNGSDLAITSGSLTNDQGTIAHAGNGTLTIKTGALSSNHGSIATNGALALTAAALSNQAGTLSAQRQATLGVQSLDNTAAGYIGADSITIKSQGAINNKTGAIESNHALTISADGLANDGGAVKALGTDALSVTTTSALTNKAGGTIGGNGDVSVSGGTVDNSNGSLLAAQSLLVQSNGQLGNAAGLIQSNGNLKVAALGAVLNSGGQIEANGATATLQLSGSSIDNSDGRIANIGTGATTIDGGASITNTDASGKAGAGTIGGNGDVTLTAQTLTNAQGGQTLAGHDLTLNIASNANNAGGALSAANNLTFNGANAVLSNQNGSVHANGVLSLAAASIDDTSGKIGNDAGSGGSIAIQTGALSNSGGAIGSDQDLSLTAGTLTGDGSIVAGRNGSVSLTGDYTQTAANKLHANGDLSFTTSGKLTNQGVMDANGALTVNAANVENQSGADLNSASTTVNANGGTIDNAGRIEGDTVTTNSTTLNNTGTVIGSNVTANAATITNSGAAAVFAAANQLNLYASNQLSNTGGANLFSVGDINIAANGQRDANGLLANRTQNVLNDQSTIEAQGNIELAAGTFTNSRPAPTVTTETIGTTTSHQTKRQKYIVCATMNADPNGGCSQAMWVNGYKTALTSSYSPSQIVSETSGPNATDKVLVVTVNGKQQTIYYNTLTTNADGSVTVNYWDAYDPHVNYVPDTEYTTRSDGHNGYQRVEIWRDTTSTTQQDKVTSQAPQAQLVAGGTITMANVGTVNNNYSAIAAGKSIQIGSTQQNGSVGSGSYGGTVVNNVGRTVYQYQTDNIVSMYAWNEDTTQDRGTIVEPTVVHTPLAIGGTGGTIIANQSVTIDAQSVNSQNVAAQNSATGATGGTLGANQNNGGVSGSTPATVAGASGGQLTKVGTASGSTTVPPLQSVASATGALSITLPTSGMYSIHPAPGQPYLVVTDPRLTSYTNFISSDYMLGQLNLNPASVEKRLGDGMYEQQMVRNQITQLTGRTFLPGYASAEDEYRGLMTNGANYAKSFGLVPGMALTAAQMDALTSDIVWLVDQTVTLPDGSTTHVLAPVVYMSQTHANDLQPTGALIAADDVEIHTVGSTTNSGVIKGGTKTVLTATDILNRGGTISSSATNGATQVVASNDVVNSSGMITGNRVAVSAGRDIINTTLVDTVGATGASGASKVSTSLIGQQGTIAATGDLSVEASRDLTLHGANLSAGGDALVTAGRDINVDTVQSTTNQSMYLNDQHHWEESKKTNVTSGVTAGGSLGMQSGNDTTFKGATVIAGKDLSVLAGGNLMATTVTDTAKLDNVAADSKTRKEVDHNYDEHAVGTQFTAGGNAALGAASTDASKGNVTLTGSSLTAGMTNGVENATGAASIVATGNITVNEAREEHDKYQDVQVSRGSFVSSTKTAAMTDTHANVGVGSTVSGNTVNIQSGRDLTVQGSTVVGTNDVSLAATNNVNITTSKDTVTQDSYYRETHSGIGTSGLSVSIGTQKKTDTDHASSVTNNASTVGSLNGNLTVRAGDTLHVTGSDLIAGKNLTGSAANVVIDSATDTSNKTHSETTSSSGVTLGLSGSIGDAINGAYQQAQAAKSGAGDSRATALHAIAAAGDAAMGVAGLTGGALAGGGAPSIGVQVSVGSSHSRLDTSENQTTQRGSNVKADGTTSLIATGNGTPGSGNITVAGSNVSGNDVLLVAKNQIDLQNTTNTDSTRSSNSSSSASVGVSIGSNGIGVSAAMSRAHGDGNSDAAMQNNSHITGANNVTLLSGGDTNVIGSNVSGGTVKADVGGNLNVQSVQDTTYSTAHQSSAGGGLSVSTMGGGSASFSAQNGHADGNYAGVNEQAGIQAGSGGFDVTVKGNTDLKGAYIGSTADAAKNTLTTGSLTYSDIENHSHYAADSNGFSAGVGVGVTGKAIGPGSVSGSGGVTPMISQSDSGDENATTRSGVSAGTINITNAASQTQDVANLSRDTSNLNGAVSKTPDVQNLLDKQADTMNAAQAAGQVVSQGIGAYADMKRDAALSTAKDATAAAKAAMQAGDTDTAEAYAATASQALSDAKSWSEGGDSRALMQTAGGALIGGLGGGSVFSTVGGAAGAGLSSKLAPQTEAVSDSIAGAAGSTLVGNVAGNVLAGVGGALVGGSSGAAMASNVDLYNQALDTKNKAANKESASLAQQVIDLYKAIQSARQTGSNAISSGVGQIVGMVQANARHIMGLPPAAQIANGINAGVSVVTSVAGGGEPPINPGTALATSAGEQAANAALTGSRGAPSNAILSNGGGSTDDSNQGQASSQSASSSNPQGTNGAGSNSFPQATSADIDALRAKYSVPEGNTLAVARTDIPGMQGEVLEGLSPSIRSQAGLPSLDEVYGADRPIKSPYQNPLFTRHAEEDLFNGVAQQIDSSGLKGTDLAGKTLDVQISNMSGVCNKCTAGLAGSSDLSGVVQQFSNRYPDLTVRISAVGGNAMPGRTTIVVRGGKIVN